MEINKELFLEKLNAIKPGLSNKDIIEFADSITFTGTHLITYNDIIAVVCPMKSDIKGTVKADKLHAHIQKVKADKSGNIKIITKDDDLLVKSGRSRAGFPINYEAQISLEELGKPIKKWHKLPIDFTEGMRLSIFAAGTDASDPKLTCLHVKGNQVQSSNGHRAFQYKMESALNKEFLLPATSAPSILNHDIRKYSITKNWVHFKTGDKTIISCRMYADTSFPDTSFLFKVKGNKLVFPDQLKIVIDRAVDFIGDDDDDKNIHILINKKKMKVKSKSDFGWFEENIVTKFNEKVSFEINPFFLKDILKTAMKATLDRKKGLLKFQADKWKYVVNVAVE